MVIIVLYLNFLCCTRHTTVGTFKAMPQAAHQASIISGQHAVGRQFLLYVELLVKSIEENPFI